MTEKISKKPIQQPTFIGNSSNADEKKRNEVKEIINNVFNKKKLHKTTAPSLKNPINLIKK